MLVLVLKQISNFVVLSSEYNVIDVFLYFYIVYLFKGQVKCKHLLEPFYEVDCKILKKTI